MLRSELAKRWDVTERFIRTLSHEGVISGYPELHTGKAGQPRVGYKEELVEQIEKQYNIPSDPINERHACKLLGFNRQAMRGLNLKCAKLSNLYWLYSKHDIEIIQKITRGEL